MIPKRIHYCWLSGDPYPEAVQDCIESWHRLMPEFEFVLWDRQRIQEIDSLWLNECIESKKWAFAADYIRLYALYSQGGIYLDTDVMVYKSFIPLLKLDAFIGREWTWHTERFLNQQYLTSHCMGAEAGNAFVGKCLNYYQGRHFILQDDVSLPDNLRFNQMLLPQIQCELAAQMGYNANLHYDKKVISLPSVTVYPSSYFDPHKVVRDSFCRHLCMGGWIGERPEEKITWSYRIKYHLDLCLKQLITWVWHVL